MRLILLSLSVLSLLVFEPSAADASAPTGVQKKAVAQISANKGQRRSSRARARRSGRVAAFVPPPPAAMPNILPEVTARRMNASGLPVDEDATEVAIVPENRYKQYIKTPSGDAPMPIESRKGVAVWNHRR